MLITVVIVLEAVCITNNLYEGIIWLIFPSFLVLSNDILVKVFTKLIGRNKILKISSKHSLEGFIAGIFINMLIAFFVIQLKITLFIKFYYIHIFS